METLFTDNNISLPISMPNAILNINSVVRAYFNDINAYTTAVSYDFTKSSIGIIGVRLLKNTTASDSKNIKGYAMIIGY